jgi:hypothetical protein
MVSLALALALGRLPAAQRLQIGWCALAVAAAHAAIAIASRVRIEVKFDSQRPATG